MLKRIKKIWAAWNKAWNRFDAWVARKAPGIKTKIVAAIGAVASAAATLQEYVSGLPLEHWITANNIVILNVVLFSMAFWFRGLASRE